MDHLEKLTPIADGLVVALQLLMPLPHLDTAAQAGHAASRFPSLTSRCVSSQYATFKLC